MQCEKLNASAQISYQITFDHRKLTALVVLGGDGGGQGQRQFGIRRMRFVRNSCSAGKCKAKPTKLLKEAKHQNAPIGMKRTNFSIFRCDRAMTHTTQNVPSGLGIRQCQRRPGTRPLLPPLRTRFLPSVARAKHAFVAYRLILLFLHFSFSVLVWRLRIAVWHGRNRKPKTNPLAVPKCIERIVYVSSARQLRQLHL